MVTLTTSTFPILESLKPIHFVDHIMQSITWTLALITSSFFFDLNQLTMGAEVEFVYNVLSFVCKCTRKVLSNPKYNDNSLMLHQFL